MAEEQSIAMAQNPKPLDDGTPLRVRRGRVESVDLYEIKDTELETLEKGTPADLQFNFAVFLLSIAFSAMASLATADFPNKIIENIFLFISILGILIGAYLLFAWWGTKSEVKLLCKRIRQRIPPDILSSAADEEDQDDPIQPVLETDPPPQG